MQTRSKMSSDSFATPLTHVFIMMKCCILTVDWAVKQILWTGRTCVNKQKQSHGWVEMVGNMKWYMQMPTWDRGSLESVSAYGQKRVTQRASKWLGTPQGQCPINQLRSYGLIWQCICIFVCLSHITEALSPRKSKESYIFFLRPNIMILSFIIFSSFSSVHNRNNYQNLAVNLFQQKKFFLMLVIQKHPYFLFPAWQ